MLPCRKAALHLKSPYIISPSCLAERFNFPWSNNFATTTAGLTSEGANNKEHFSPFVTEIAIIATCFFFFCWRWNCECWDAFGTLVVWLLSFFFVFAAESQTGETHPARRTHERKWSNHLAFVQFAHPYSHYIIYELRESMSMARRTARPCKCKEPVSDTRFSGNIENLYIYKTMRAAINVRRSPVQLMRNESGTLFDHFRFSLPYLRCTLFLFGCCEMADWVLAGWLAGSARPRMFNLKFAHGVGNGNYNNHYYYCYYHCVVICTDAVRCCAAIGQATWHRRAVSNITIIIIIVDAFWCGWNFIRMMKIRIGSAWHSRHNARALRTHSPGK